MELFFCELQLNNGTLTNPGNKQSQNILTHSNISLIQLARVLTDIHTRTLGYASYSSFLPTVGAVGSRVGLVIERFESRIGQ
jgi:hypothetical protein